MQPKINPFGFFFALFICCLVSPWQLAHGQTKLLYESFESVSSFTNKWQLSSFPDTSQWGVVNKDFGGEGVCRGTNKLYCSGKGYRGTTASPYYPDSMSTTFFKQSVNFSNLINARLTFWYKAKIYPGGIQKIGEYEYDMDNEWEEDRFSVSIDGFEIWDSQTALEDKGAQISDWTLASIDLAQAGVTFDVEEPLHTLEFHFQSDNIGQESPWLWEEETVTNKVYTRGEGIYLDDIYIEGYNGYRPDFNDDSIVDLVWQTNNPTSGNRFAAAWLLTNGLYQQVSATVTITNLTKNGMTLTVNGDKRTWTNHVVSVSTQILTNQTIGGSATNLFNQLSAHAFAGPLRIYRDSTNGVRIEGQIGQLLSVAATGKWCSIQYSTNLTYGPDYNSGLLWTNSALKMTNGWQIVGQSDFNFDNQADFIWQHTDGRLVAWVMVNGVYQESLPLKKLSSGWRLAALADLNGDFCRDFILQHTTGKLTIRYMKGTNDVSGPYYMLTNSNPLVLVSDFNSDGSKDLLFQATNTGAITIVYTSGVYPITVAGAGFSTGTSGLRLSNAWRVAGANDFDEDGYLDLVAQNTDGRVAIWYMKHNVVLRSALLRGGKSAPANWRIVGPK